MVYVHADDKARISLTKELVERYGRNFMLVPARGEIILIPVSDDPMKALAEEGKKIPSDLSIGDIKRIARERGRREALSNIAKK